VSRQHVVFVYGTLKKGGKLHYKLGGSEYAGEAALPNYTLYQFHDVGVPIMVRSLDDQVMGELYVVTNETLVMLDKAESEGKLYHRHLVTLCDGMKAWAYVWAHGVSGCEKIGETFLITGSDNGGNEEAQR
jgi:gamma-glutamylcyclotransferase (GGCT)/AIG2-like uncharacterized protein YtfP